MGLGGILQELKNEGVLALYHDYRSGRTNDLSGSGNNGVASSGTIFDKQGALLLRNTDEVTVVNSASLQLTNMSIIVGADFTSQSNEYVVSKRGGGFTHFQFYLYPGGLVFYDGVNARTLAGTVAGKKCMSMSTISGGTPIGYTDGLLLGNFSGVSTITPSNPNLEIGNWADIERVKAVLHYVVMCSRVLTATEHARVYGQLEDMQWGTKGMTPGPLLP